MAEAKTAPRAEDDARTIEVRECDVCGRSTALAMCPHCGFDPVVAQAAIDRRAKGK